MRIMYRTGIAKTLINAFILAFKLVKLIEKRAKRHLSTLRLTV